MLEFQGKRVIVTGGTSGIGLAAARAFARQGAAVVISGRGVERGTEAAGYEASPGAHISFVPADVRDEQQVERLLEQTSKILGGVDIVVNSAGVINRIPLTELAQPDWDEVLDTNLRGVYLVCKHALPPMMAQGWGAIVNVASYLGAYGSRESTPAYNASKAGVVALTRSLALQAGPSGVRVNAVCPGFVVTPLNEHLILDAPDPRAKEQDMARPYPLGRLGRPDDIAAAILFLASDEAAWITGTSLLVDGGLTAR